MAYVNFWKGLAANYSAETHAEGIYQCTDTGDTYIFGVKNSGNVSDILIQAEDDPLYFNPADSLENLQTLTFPQVTPDWLSSNFHDKYLIINQNSAQGTFGDGIQRFYTFVYQDFDWGQKSITLEWVLRVSSTEIKYRRIQIQVSTSGNTVTVIEWPLGASEVDLTGYKKIEEVSSLPASPDTNTLYVIPESTDSGESGEGTFG